MTSVASDPGIHVMPWAYGIQHGYRTMARRITRLIAEIQRDPFAGIGKPQPLKGELSGYRSRRVDDEHRLVCRADDSEVKILKVRYHYCRHRPSACTNRFRAVGI